MPKPEPRSFGAKAQDEAPVEDVLYWAHLFRATPEEIASAMRKVRDHPEPKPEDGADLHKPKA